MFGGRRTARRQTATAADHNPFLTGLIRLRGLAEPFLNHFNLINPVKAPLQSSPHAEPQKARGAAVSRSAPLYVGRKPNSVPARLLKARRRWSFISRRDFSPPRGVSRHACDRYPGRAAIARHRTGGPASLFGLAPHGVYRAPEVTLRAVGSYPAFSPLPRGPCELRGGIFSVTLSIGRDFRPGPPRLFPRHAALWCSDFPLPPRRERPSTRREGSRRGLSSQGESMGRMGPMGLMGLFCRCPICPICHIGPIRPI